MSETKADQKAVLARMSGQIADFFKAYPEQQAVEGIATHINKFWSGRMRGEFLAAFHSGDAALHPLVNKAITQIRAGKAG